MADVLFIDNSDFEEFPPGGTLTFARQLLSVFGNKFALVGISTDNTPIVRWVKKSIDGIEYDYYAVGRRRLLARKPIIPGRLSFYLQLFRSRKGVQVLGIQKVFIQNPEVIMAVSNWGWDNICYRFAGLGRNSLAVSRYRGVRVFVKAFDRMYLSAIRQADTLLAAADENAIDKMLTRHPRYFVGKQLMKFPTRVDTSIFQYRSKSLARKNIKFSEDGVIIVTCGRIHWSKGWSFLLKVFKNFVRKQPNSRFYFIGDGEDRPKLEAEVKLFNLSNSVRITGFFTTSRCSNLSLMQRTFLF